MVFIDKHFRIRVYPVVTDISERQEWLYKCMDLLFAHALPFFSSASSPAIIAISYALPENRL